MNNKDRSFTANTTILIQLSSVPLIEKKNNAMISPRKYNIKMILYFYIYNITTLLFSPFPSFILEFQFDLYLVITLTF